MVRRQADGPWSRTVFGPSLGRYHLSRDQGKVGSQLDLAMDHRKVSLGYCIPLSKRRGWALPRIWFQKVSKEHSNTQLVSQVEREWPESFPFLFPLHLQSKKYHTHVCDIHTYKYTCVIYYLYTHMTQILMIYMHVIYRLKIYTCVMYMLMVYM